MESVKQTMPRFGKTDFRDFEEMNSFAQIGRLPEDFGKRAGEFELDKQFYSMQLAAIGITSGDEYRKAMKRFADSMR